MQATTVTSKGQVTIPKAIRDVLGLRPGDLVSFFQADDGRVVLRAETLDVRSLKGLLKHDGPVVSLEEMDDAVRDGAVASSKDSE